MKILNGFSDKELKKELENRKRAKKIAPPQLDEIYLQDLRKICEDYINFIASDDYYEDNDYEHYIYETVLETFYGKQIWVWIRKNT